MQSSSIRQAGTAASWTISAADPLRPFGLNEQEKRGLEGYLGKELPNPLILLPPPPDEGSSEWETDLEMAGIYLGADEERRQQAKRDAILRFPEATRAFSGVLDLEISEEHTPSLIRILQKTRVDGGMSTYSAKRYYRRPRPFMVNRKPTLTPEDEEMLRSDGAYPSGHTAIGWIWALILTDLFPSRSEVILERGQQFGISRSICNVHWHSDVVAGRICGAAVVARLYDQSDFLIDLASARKEVAIRKNEIERQNS
jgi:acid phosphatase (class A)